MLVHATGSQEIQITFVDLRFAAFPPDCKGTPSSCLNEIYSQEAVSVILHLVCIKAYNGTNCEEVFNDQ